MKKVHLEHICDYPRDQIYLLANELGRQLTDYLGLELFLLLLDSKILLHSYHVRTSDSTWKLHCAAKGLEGFLNKLIMRKRLYEGKKDKIGEVFGKKSSILLTKIADRRLIARTKSTWDFCRNDVMHYNQNQNYKSFRYGAMDRKYEEIRELIKLLYKDFYGKTDADQKIREGLENYVFSKHRTAKDKIKGKVIWLIGRM